MDRVLLGILCILLKFMNFQVTQMYGNNGTFNSTEIQKYRNSSHEMFS